jgi:hypothetical protein
MASRRGCGEYEPRDPHDNHRRWILFAILPALATGYAIYRLATKLGMDGSDRRGTMHSILISSVVFVTIFGAALLGMFVRRWIPGEHLGTDAKDAIRLVTGITATMSGLVLGMLVSSAKGYYDARTSEVAEIASRVVTIDRLLAQYGPEMGEVRSQIHQLVEAGVDRVWRSQESLGTALRPKENVGAILHQLELMTPNGDSQAAIKAQTIPMVLGLQQMQWSMFLKTQQTSIPLPLLTVVVSWLAAIFLSIGLFAPRNRTVLVTFALGALAVSSAVFIIVEMYSPFSGILRISSAPVLDALS